MPWNPDYATVAQYKAWVYVADTDDDTQIAVALTAASRAIDQFCNRQFGTVTPAAARTFTWYGDYATARPLLIVDDVQTVTSLVVATDRDGDAVYEDTLTIADDFTMWPADSPVDGKPWTGILLRPGVTWPNKPDTVQVTALWGWTSVPTPVTQACLLQADVIMKRRNQGLGQDYTTTSRYLDRDVQQILRPFQRVWGVV